jgi:putative hydrolase
MREHYLGLVQQTLDSLDPDPKRLLDALTKVVTDLRSGRRPLDDGGIVSLFASAEQRAVLDKIGGLMSLLEGHGDITMDRAGADRIPSAHRFARVLRERRASANPGTKLLQRVIGLEAKMNQYAQGERFIEEVERLGGGPDALEPVWRGASWLPTLAEIREPEEWLDRVRLSDELVG